MTLIKSVMRAFYQTRDILVIDALILHEAYVPWDLWVSMPDSLKDFINVGSETMIWRT